MMDPLGHPHVGRSHGAQFCTWFFHIDHLNLPIAKPQKVKPSSYVE